MVVATTSDVEMNVAIQGLINLFHTLLKSHVCISIPGINISRFRSSFLKGKRAPARFRYRWKGNIKMYFKEKGWRIWIGLIWFRLGTYGGLYSKCGNELSGFIKL